MNQYKLSIIIPAYNDTSLLKMTIQSILKSNMPTDEYEILVCDDGSSVDNLKIIKQYEQQCHIRYFYQPDLGFRAGQARNMGILNSKSDICLFVDTGILIGNNTLNEFYEKVKETHSIVLGYVYGFSNKNDDEEMIKKLIDIKHIHQSIKQLQENGYLDRRETGYQELGDDLSKWPAPWVYFSGGLTAIEKEKLDKAGLFDEHFCQWGAEDSELGLRLYLAGYKMILNRNANGIHYPHEKRNHIQEGWDQFIQNLKKQRAYIYSKHPLPEVLAWSTVHMNSDTFNQYLIDSLGLKEYYGCGNS